MLAVYDPELDEAKNEDLWLGVVKRTSTDLQSQGPSLPGTLG
jgi:hypothetical protein